MAEQPNIQADVKATNRLIKYLITMFLCMVIGAFIYSGLTETLDQCRALYGAADLQPYAPK